MSFFGNSILEVKLEVIDKSKCFSLAELFFLETNYSHPCILLAHQQQQKTKS